MKNKYAFIIATLFLLAILPFAYAEDIVVATGTYESLSGITDGQEKVFFDERIAKHGNYLISSVRNYYAYWYPDSSPKNNLKQLVIELVIEEKNKETYFLKGTADIPKYYTGEFDVDTNDPKLVIFRDGYNPTIKWEVTTSYDNIVEDKKVEKENITEITKVNKKKGKSYTPIASISDYVTANIKSKVTLDPDVSACGTLGTENGIYTMTASISNNTASCFTITAKNVTLDCQGFNITGANLNTFSAITTANESITVKNCKIYDYWKSIAVGTYNYNQILNNTIVSYNSSNNYGIGGFKSNFTIVRNNYIYINSSVSGITFDASDGVLIEYNNVTQLLYSGIKLTLNSVPAINNIVRHNYVQTPITTGNGRGIYVTGAGSNNNTIYNNTVNAGSIGILLENCGSHNVTNNYAYSTNGQGLYLLASNNNYVSGNNCTALTGGSAIFVTSSSNSSTITNNYATQLGGATYYGLYVVSSSNHNLFNNNKIYHTAQDGHAAVIEGTATNNTFTNDDAWTNSSNGRGAWYLTGSSGNFYNNNLAVCSYGTNCYGMYLTTAQNNTFTQGLYIGSSRGLSMIVNSNGNVFSNIWFNGTSYGVYMHNSHYNNFTTNSVDSDNGRGFFVDGASTNNRVVDITIRALNTAIYVLGSSLTNTFINSTATTSATNQPGIYLLNAINTTLDNTHSSNHIQIQNTTGGSAYLYGLVNALAYWNNYSLAWGSTISSNDGNLNLTVPQGNITYVLENYGVSSTTRLADPISSALTETRLTITSSLLSSITSTVTIPIGVCNDLNSITYNGVTTTGDAAKNYCTSFETGGTFLLLSGANILDWVGGKGSTPLSNTILKILLGFIALATLGASLGAIYWFAKNNFQTMSIQQWMGFIVTLLIVTFLMIALMNYIVTIL